MKYTEEQKAIIIEKELSKIEKPKDFDTPKIIDGYYIYESKINLLNL